jgi:hypothetical protein
MNIKLECKDQRPDGPLWGNYVNIFPALLALQPLEEAVVEFEKLDKETCADARRYLDKTKKYIHEENSKKMEKYADKLGKELKRIAEAVMAMAEGEDDE